MIKKEKIPICQECHKKDKVVKITYENWWLGYECERCYCVVKEIYYTNEKGKKVYK